MIFKNIKKSRKINHFLVKKAVCTIEMVCRMSHRIFKWIFSNNQNLTFQIRDSQRPRNIEIWRIRLNQPTLLKLHVVLCSTGCEDYWGPSLTIPRLGYPSPLDYAQWFGRAPRLRLDNCQGCVRMLATATERKQKNNLCQSAERVL